MSTPAAADGIPGSGRREDSDQPAVATAAAARRRVSELLERAGVGLDSVIATDALLVTTELFTNAIRHGGGITLFHTTITGNALHLSVGDASTRTPTPRPNSPLLPGGHGWPLIQRLTEHIGVTLLPDGKIINAVLRLA
ncbi:ATP-binding protein [Streptomyces sp. NPDC060334]|uniref:ATP-binding protein n=1 Tax=Streptomyces sp. NPDC060334 TaxID=3347099 RepID=UPI003657B3D5